MNGALAAALALAALGLALGFSSARATIGPALALATGALAGLWVPSLPAGIEAAALLILVATLAATLWLSTLRRASIALGAATGLVAGALADDALTLAVALPAVLIALPAGWAVRRGWDIVVKIAASWLVATALLAGALPLVTTPGYVSDHRE